MGRSCEMCPEDSSMLATVFCLADACFLCPTCDEEVHSANRLARRHVRRPVMKQDIADGSSINDDSELALVPDVSPLPSKTGDVSPELDDPSSSNEMLLIGLPNNAPVSYEDAADFDFCDFEGGLGGKMPALCAIDDDAMFSGSKAFGKSFYGDISWENVVPENIEHVVPDVSEPARSTVAISFLKREASDVDMTLNAPKVVSSTKLARGGKNGKDKVRATTVVNRSAKTVKKEDDIVAKVEPTLSSSTTGTAILGKRKVRENSENDVEDHSEDSNSMSKTDTETEAEKDQEAKNAEIRKKRRMEALARFRSKRANRSFTKRVRYECRKQLADSRPRVKGRFVRKIEMALFRKYGALYREHLDELKQPQSLVAPTNVVSTSPQSTTDQCIPAL